MGEPFDMYVVSSVAGRLMFHTCSLWANRSICKFCPLDDWPKWQTIGYHIRKLRVTNEMKMDGIFEEANLIRAIKANRS